MIGLSYIIEKIALYENANMHVTNLVVKNNTIYSRDTNVDRMKFIRLHLDKHIMIASETVLGNIDQWKNDGIEYAKEVVLLGATTVVFPIDVQCVYQLHSNVEEARELLKGFPLDYVIVLRIPQSMMKQEVVRYCRKHSISAVIITIKDVSEIKQISWSWIKDAIFPYRLVFIPQFLESDEHQLRLWRQLLSREKISHFSLPFSYHRSLSKDELKKMGVYPFKGIIRSGGEVSYNLIKEMNQKCLIYNEETYYDKIELTIFKNEVIRVGNLVTFPSFTGKELKIKVPGYFQ